MYNCQISLLQPSDLSVVLALCGHADFSPNEERVSFSDRKAHSIFHAMRQPSGEEEEEEEKFVVFRNCLLLRNHAIVKEDLWVRRGKIIDPSEGWSQLSEVHIFLFNTTLLWIRIHSL